MYMPCTGELFCAFLAVVRRKADPDGLVRSWLDDHSLRSNLQVGLPGVRLTERLLKTEITPHQLMCHLLKKSAPRL